MGGAQLLASRAMSQITPSLEKARALCAFSYVVAGTAGLIAAWLSPWPEPLYRALFGDVIATIVIFAFSVRYSNSSFYDAYWSVAPFAIVLYWIAVGSEAVGARQGLVMLLVTLWGARLTFNWARGWTGLDHEDWRYINIKNATGFFYWPVSFLGIHMMPTLMVFGGLLPAWAACAEPGAPLGVLDGIALFVGLGAIWIEARSDKELHAFRSSNPAPGSILDTGLWAWSRHPNYFGEMAFWWSLGLLGLAAGTQYAWALAGPAAITLLFQVVSLPMIEKRMRERRPDWDDYVARVGRVLPRPARPLPEAAKSDA